MNILFVNVKNPYVDSNNPPLGLGYIVSYLLKAKTNDDIRVVDLTVDQLPFEEFSRIYLDSFQPDLIGITIVTPTYVYAVDIAKKINLTPEAISYRIRNLINEKVIVSFFPLINISSLGYHWYTVSLNLHNITKEKEKELLAYLKAHPNIIVVIKTVGEWNIEFDVHIDSSVKFRELLMQIREQFSDIINDVESNLIFNDYKYTHLPNGLLK